MYCFSFVTDPICTCIVHVGVGRIIAEAKFTPTVIPFWHIGTVFMYMYMYCYLCAFSNKYYCTGMDDMLPNYAPYIPRLFKV